MYWLWIMDESDEPRWNWEHLPLNPHSRGKTHPEDGEVITGRNVTVRVGRRPRNGEPSPVERRAPILLRLERIRCAPEAVGKGGPGTVRLTDAEALQLADALRDAVNADRPSAPEGTRSASRQRADWPQRHATMFHVLLNSGAIMLTIYWSLQ